MGKEVKIGLAVIAVLLGAFGFVLYQRLKTSSEKLAAEAAAAPAEKAAAEEPTTLSSGPLKPTMLAAQTSKSSASARALGDASSMNANARYSAPLASDTASQSPAASGDVPSGRFSSRYDSNARSNRYADRYGEPATTENADGSPVPAAGGDPFRSQPGSFSAQAGGQTAASAALVQAADGSATAPGGGALAANSGSAVSDPAENPLRGDSDLSSPAGTALVGTASTGTASTGTASSSTASADTASASTASADSSLDSGATPRSGGYSSGPRSYNLYGDDPTPTGNGSTTATSSGPDSTGGASFRPSPTRSSASPSGQALPPQSPVGSGLSTSAARERDSFSSGRYSSAASATASSLKTPSSAASSAATSSFSPQTSSSASLDRAAKSRSFAQTGAGSPETYIVEPNDHYWSISTKVYGSGAYFKALQEHNRSRLPHGDLLKTGDVVAVPSVETLTKNYPELCPLPGRATPARTASAVSSSYGGGRLYTVEEGDTLFDIARFELGKATRWAEIFELNKDRIGDDFNHLRPGTQIVLPEEQTDTFTRRPSVGLQR